MKDNEIKTYSQTELNYNDTFTALFDELYEGYNIKRIGANRMINSKGSKRGRVTELLISNF